MTQPVRTTSSLGHLPYLGFTFLAVLLALLCLTPPAQASKQAVEFFGGEGTLGGQFETSNFGEFYGAVAVNNSGAGPANVGDVYVTDPINNRIERFGRDDNGTPGNTGDDTYFFISAWGADVVSAGGSGDVGEGYEVCTVASQCKAGVASAGNGAVSISPSGGRIVGLIALDQDTGELYLTDTDNNRVNVYAGDGTFLRSFGYDVIASGPDDAGTGYEVCIAANGDVCKVGLRGSGPGQIGTATNGVDQFSGAQGIALSAADGNPASGTVFLADGGNQRVDTYRLDGTSPSSIGSPAQFESRFPTSVAVDSRGILYAGNFIDEGETSKNKYPVERYDTTGVDGPVGFLAPIEQGVNEIQEVTVSATAGTFKLCFDPDEGGPQPVECTTDLAYNALAQGPSSVMEALRALPSLGGNFGFANGGPGDAAGSKPYTITFEHHLSARDLPQLSCSSGATPLSGGSGCAVTTATTGQSGLASGGPASIVAVDPDEDGAGSETDVLFAGRNGGVIQQFGPANPPGLLAAPSLDDERHNTNGTTGGNSLAGLAMEPSTGRIYVTPYASSPAGPGVYVLDNASPTPPTGSMDSVDGITAKSADLHATIDPNGPPVTRYHFEYSSDGVNWTSLPEVLLGSQETPQTIEAHLEPPPIGLNPNALYHVRVVFGRKFASPVTSNELTFTTAAVPPLAETAGAPVRTTTTAQLNGRIAPLDSATTYHFEYGTQGPCDANPCTSTSELPAGSGYAFELVGEELTALQPDTTYHYRLVASNGVGSPVAGADTTVHTRASDELANQDDTYPGPPGSDRAWEQVSLPESSGNPVSTVGGFSSAGDRAVYDIAGGTPISSVGSFLSIYFAQRPPGAHPTSGWQTINISPDRDQLIGPSWPYFKGTDDLSAMVSPNAGNAGSQLWELFASGPPLPLPGGRDAASNLSADGSRVVALLSGGGIDPDHSAATGYNVYDITASPPRLLSLLPGDQLPPCGVGASSAYNTVESRWLSADGSNLYFEASSAGLCKPGEFGGPDPQLYVREVGAEQTKLLSGPVVSGPQCRAKLIKATPSAAFFATQSRLDPADSVPAGCADASQNDVYRYVFSNGSLDCVTCVVPGYPAAVEGTEPSDIAVADDGSRVYFTTARRLLPGAPAAGGIYRVDVASHSLAYVAPLTNSHIGNDSKAAQLSPDGHTFAFSSNQASLNPLGATFRNAGTTQYYRYSDADRSLICYSCPQDGSVPPAGLSQILFSAAGAPGQPNERSLSSDGNTLAFVTPTPLVGADQNTPGPGGDLESAIDAYEWRDGRLLLVTDGLSNWPGGLTSPSVEGMTPSGSDIFFTAPARYTADAPDAMRRLYDARIGGGIDLPKAVPPCPLEVCQGIPKGAPEEQEPSSSNFSGPGNVGKPTQGRCPKGKRRKGSGAKARCVKPRKPHHRRAANHDRRAHR